MRWSDLRQSRNIDDRRGLGGRGVAVGGGGIGILILAVAIYLCGGDPTQLFQGGIPQGEQPVPQTASNSAAPQDTNRQFAGAIIGSLEDMWREVLPQQARMRLREPKLVLFTGQVQSACGYASAATGPFYCPGDEKLYLDFAFFDELRREFKAPGDFAQAYVIAHEYGHHIQNLTGMMSKVQSAGQNNRLSVALELQADCYAGIWANHAQKDAGVRYPGFVHPRFGTTAYAVVYKGNADRRYAAMPDIALAASRSYKKSAAPKVRFEGSQT
jgi:uncharacterized protein